MKAGEIHVRPLPVAGSHGVTGQSDIAMAKVPGITVGKCSPPSRDEQSAMADCRGGFNLKPETTGRMQSQLQNLFHTLLHELMTAKTRIHVIETSI